MKVLIIDTSVVNKFCDMSALRPNAVPRVEAEETERLAPERSDSLKDIKLPFVEVAELHNRHAALFWPR